MHDCSHACYYNITWGDHTTLIIVRLVRCCYLNPPLPCRPVPFQQQWTTSIRLEWFHTCYENWLLFHSIWNIWKMMQTERRISLCACTSSSPGLASATSVWVMRLPLFPKIKFELIWTKYGENTQKHIQNALSLNLHSQRRQLQPPHRRILHLSREFPMLSSVWTAACFFLPAPHHS